MTLVDRVHDVNLPEPPTSADSDALRQMFAAAAAREREAAAHARALSEMKTAVLNAVSHHVRTPLTSILGFSQLLADGALPPDKAAPFAARLRSAALELEDTLQAILDTNRLGDELSAITRGPTDVAAIARRVADDLHTHPVVVEGDGSYNVDAAAVGRILSSLLKNAASHAPAGSPIRVVVAGHGRAARIEVHDRGPGIPPEDRSRIFDPFTQGRVAREHAPGLGLGLTLVGHIARLHGGGAWVQDTGGGACLVVELGESDDEVVLTQRGARILELVRQHLDMDLAFVGQVTTDEEIFLAVDAAGGVPGPEVGERFARAETYCDRMLGGTIGPVVPDTSAVRELADLQVTHDWGVRAYIGVPVDSGTGTPIGALCCMSRTPRHDLDETQVAVLRFAADLLAGEIGTT